MLLDPNGNPIPTKAPDTVDDATRLKAQEKSDQISKALRLHRKILKADEVVAMKQLRVRLEQQFPKLNAFFFTIDGVLEGKPVRGALLAGECMLVFASSESQARKIATEGMQTTLELLYQEFEDRRSAEIRNSILNAGIHGPDAGGRRGTPGAPVIQHPTMKKLARIIAHVIGGEPWKG